MRRERATQAGFNTKAAQSARSSALSRAARLRNAATCAGVISLSGMMVSITGSAACNVLAPIANVTGGVLLSLNGAIATLAGLVTHVQGGKLVRVGSGKIVLAAGGECLIQGAPVKLN